MKKKIFWSRLDSSDLAQLINKGVEFSLVSDDDYQASPFFFCKDFVQDAIYGTINKKRIFVYGFTYSPLSRHQPSLKKVRLMMANSDDSKMRNRIDGCLDFVHQIEDKLNIAPTKITECIDPPRQYLRSGVWYIEGNKRWAQSPPMISMYTLFLRAGLDHPLGNTYDQTIHGIIEKEIKIHQSVDRKRLKSALPGIQRILETGDKEIFHKRMKDNYLKEWDTKTVHDTLGIVGFSKGFSKQYMPYWHR